MEDLITIGDLEKEKRPETRRGCREGTRDNLKKIVKLFCDTYGMQIPVHRDRESRDIWRPRQTSG